MSRGVWYAIGAYLSWGLFPIYWKALHQVPALELICHRIVWSCLTLYILIAIRGRWSTFTEAFTQPRVIGLYLIASVLIGINWLLFIVAVNSGYIIETSLGYFINPLLSVVLGVIFFKEKLRRLQWVAIGLAAAAVLYLAIVYGALPKYALALALTFSLYGLVKKVAPLGAVVGMTLETTLLLIPGFAYLAWQGHNGQAAYLHVSQFKLVLLLCSGMVTTLPLLLFAGAAQRIPLAQIGLLQYMAPTIQFLLGALMFHERVTAIQLGGYVLVWISLALFGAEGVYHYQKSDLTAEQCAR